MLPSLPADLTTTGPLIAFVSVLAGSLGIPVPTLAAVIFVGSLLATRHGSVETGAAVFAAAMAGAVLGDVAWFFAGRRYDTSVLGLICRLSLSRDSCVRRTADAFKRRGVKVLLFARFLPGLSVISAPLAGISGVSLARFVIPGALFLPNKQSEQPALRTSLLKPVIIYCSCPNEVSAAVLAKRMRKLGFADVRPLLGGIDAWRKAGHPVLPIIRPGKPAAIDLDAGNLMQMPAVSPGG